MIYDKLSMIDVNLSEELIEKFSAFSNKIEKQIYIIKNR